MTTKNFPEFLTVKEIAVILKRSEVTIRRWIRDSKIPYVQLPNNRLLFDLDKVLEWWSTQLPIQNKPAPEEVKTNKILVIDRTSVYSSRVKDRIIEAGQVLRNLESDEENK